MSDAREVKSHHLKCWPEFFALVRFGFKVFEYRKDDRGFMVGDELVLEEYCPRRAMYTGERLSARVALIVRNVPGLPEGYCIMQLANVMEIC